LPGLYATLIGRSQPSETAFDHHAACVAVVNDLVAGNAGGKLLAKVRKSPFQAQ
jgi:hypothetical protein